MDGRMESMKRIYKRVDDFPLEGFGFWNERQANRKIARVEDAPFSKDQLFLPKPARVKGSPKNGGAPCGFPLTST